MKDPIQRSYLGRDGWWADDVIREFSFLADYGIEFDHLSFHQTDHSLIYRGRRHDLFFVYAPDKFESFLLAWMSWKPEEATAGLDDVIRHDAPALVPPLAIPGDRDAIRKRIRYWAKGLLLVADRLFDDSEPWCLPLQGGQAQG